MSEPVLGIDLGTTHSLVGIYEAGFPGLLSDPEGRRLTPSVVSFPAQGEPLTGWAALRQMALQPTRTIVSIKRLMGVRFSEIDPAAFPFPVAAGPEGQAAIPVDGRLWLPEEISALILGKLKADAVAALGREVSKAVITVPAYFHDGQRAATKRAGELAGLQVERILSEPTAAALAYGLDRLGEKSRVAVFDFGGGTFDLSVLELSNGVFEVLATHGDTRLGGDDIDRALVHSFISRLGTELSNGVARARLLEEAVRVKVVLSQETECMARLPFLGENDHRESPVTREELEAAASAVLRRIEPLCRRALHDAGVSPSDLDEVILVGGSTRMPAVRKLAAKIFEREPNISQHPDEAIALGAAIQAGILSGDVQRVTLLDVTPLSLGIETFGGLMNVLIPRNTSIPCKAGEMFTNAAAGQDSMQITVLQGERELAADNWKLGEFVVPFTPAPRGQARVGVQFSIDANGILQVLARDTATGVDQVLEVQSAIEVEEEQVEAMISSSLEHAFEDMNERVFTEAKMKAEELLAAMDAAFAQLGDSLSDAERQEIEATATMAREAIRVRDARNLKAAVEELDRRTEPLATLLLEKLMADPETSQRIS